MNVTQEEVDEILNHLSLKQMEQVTTLAMRKVFELCPTARLIRARQATGEVCVGIVDGNQLLTDWKPYNANMKEIYLLWCDAALQLIYQPKLFIVGRA